MTDACRRCGELEAELTAALEQIPDPEFDNDEGMALELDAVLEFIQRRSVDAFRVGDENASKFFDDLCDSLRREEHRK